MSASGGTPVTLVHVGAAERSAKGRDDMEYKSEGMMMLLMMMMMMK